MSDHEMQCSAGEEPEPMQKAPTPKAKPDQASKRAPGSRVGITQGRKAKACHECKKLKVRCEVFPGDQKCRYCLRRNVPCLFSKTVASHYKDAFQDGVTLSPDTAQLGAMREEIRQMRASLDAVLAKYATKEERVATQTLLSVKNLPGPSPEITKPTESPSNLSAIRDDNTQMAMTRENSVEPGPSEDVNEPVTLEEPMGSLYEVTRLRNIRSNRAKTARPSTGQLMVTDDFISRGVISERDAEKLYEVFSSTLNHYLWAGLEDAHKSFTSIRHSSELLAATILTVTALHMPTSASTFDACYKEFLALISSSMFSRYHSIDDVRALCIAAFWLSDVSWKLCGHAIRIATELNIHQSFSKALQGDKEHFLRARLWYMLYVCDRHFSIAYGRPPMVSESIQIREHELFLASPLSSVLDARILSQVSLMQILTRVYDRFSERRLPDLDYVRSGGGGGGMSHLLPDARSAKQYDEVGSAMLSDYELEALGAFNLEIDQWRMRWYPRQPPNPIIGEFPRRGVVLYSYFAKLQINSLAVRGVSRSSGRLSTERKEFANMAVSAAVSILSILLDETDMQKSLVGQPLYLHSMIAFASVFLMKAATRWDRLMGLNIEYAFVSNLLERTVVLLQGAVTSDRHMIKHIAQGLHGMLGRLKSARDSEQVSMLPRTYNGSTRNGDSLPTGGMVAGCQLGPTDQFTDGLRNEADGQVPHDMASGSPGDPISGVQGWAPGAFHSHSGPGGDWEAAFGAPSSESAILNDQFMFETFGAGSANDVYNLLSTHIQH